MCLVGSDIYIRGAYVYILLFGAVVESSDKITLYPIFIILKFTFNWRIIALWKEVMTNSDSILNGKDIAL